MIVNGQFQTDISIADRALQYGDGCFTTMLLRDGYLEYFEDHLLRLHKACQALGIEFTSWSELKKSIQCSVQSLTTPVQDVVIKIIISRGQGGRGYSPVGCAHPSYIISHHAYPKHYGDWSKIGIPITVSAIKLSKQPFLAGIKHLNRLEQVLIKQELASTQYSDALVCDIDDNIIETSIANLFLLEDGQWFTPDLSASGVEGVLRKKIIQLFAENNVKLRVGLKQVTELKVIQEMFVCNSLMQIVPIHSVYLPKSSTTLNVASKKQTELFQTWLEALRTKQRVLVNELA